MSYLAAHQPLYTRIDGQVFFQDEAKERFLGGDGVWCLNFHMKHANVIPRGGG
jgi:hypothetical protein